MLSTFKNKVPILENDNLKKTYERNCRSKSIKLYLNIFQKLF